MLLAISLYAVAKSPPDVFVLVGLVVSLALAFIPGLVARHKGLPMWDWWFMGVLILPLALVVLIPDPSDPGRAKAALPTR